MEATTEQTELPATSVHSSPPLPAPSSRWAPWLAQRGAELFTVFVGVYAAFLLNGYQQRHQERQRRAQLLTWMESVYRTERDDLKRESANMERMSEDFRRRLGAGEMPPLRAFNWTSDYDPTDIVGLLQNSGYALLEIDTVRAIKEADGTLRSMVSLLHHDQQLSDALILPNLGKYPDVFYDPATRKLRESYEWYARFFDQEAASYAQLQTQVERVLERLRAERDRNR